MLVVHSDQVGINMCWHKYVTYMSRVLQSPHCGFCMSVYYMNQELSGCCFDASLMQVILLSFSYFLFLLIYFLIFMVDLVFSFQEIRILWLGQMELVPNLNSHLKLESMRQ